MYFSVQPDYRIEVCQDILGETDGQMLPHGLRDINHVRIELRSSAQDRPDPASLRLRYEDFKSREDRAWDVS